MMIWSVKYHINHTKGFCLNLNCSWILLGINHKQKRHWGLSIPDPQCEWIYAIFRYIFLLFAWRVHFSFSYLPSLVSSSNSDGERLVRRHNAAIIPMCNVRQQTKSMISNSSNTPPTATAMIDAELKTWPSFRITKSFPDCWIFWGGFFFLFVVLILSVFFVLQTHVLYSRHQTSQFA